MLTLDGRLSLEMAAIASVQPQVDFEDLSSAQPGHRSFSGAVVLS